MNKPFGSHRSTVGTIPLGLETRAFNTQLTAPVLIELQQSPWDILERSESWGEMLSALGLGMIFDVDNLDWNRALPPTDIPLILRCSFPSLNDNVKLADFNEIAGRLQAISCIVKCEQMVDEELKALKFLSLTMPVPLIVQINSAIDDEKFDELINIEMAGFYAPDVFDNQSDRHANFSPLKRRPRTVLISIHDDSEPLRPYRQGVDMTVLRVDCSHALEAVKSSICDRIHRLSADLSVLGMPHPHYLRSI